jgi:rsbT co-antagonist protein RsbR
VLIERFGSDPKRLGEALVAMSAYLDSSMSLVGDEYVATKERIITQQQEAIKELSTPVLQIRDRLLLVPLVGLLDTQRARAMTEQLLHAIRAHRAKVVVIDITGVPAVDSKVAHHLFQTLSAARLMGAHTVVTGVSAEVAESLVVLGVDIEALNTVGDLQGGLEEAERWLAHKRAPVDESAPLEPVGRA